MKTKLLAICLFLFTFQVFGEEVKVLKEDSLMYGAVKLSVVCIDGYKYLNTNRQYNSMNFVNSTIQMFEERDGKSLPARCN